MDRGPVDRTAPRDPTFVCVTRRSNVVTVYLNGADATKPGTRQNAPGVVNSGGGTLRIGHGKHYAGFFYAGRIEDLQILDGAVADGSVVPSGPLSGAAV